MPLAQIALMIQIPLSEVYLTSLVVDPSVPISLFLATVAYGLLIMGTCVAMVPIFQIIIPFVAATNGLLQEMRQVGKFRPDVFTTLHFWIS